MPPLPDNGLPSEIYRVRGDGKRGVAALVTNGRIRGEPQGNDARPNWKRVIVGVVFDRANTNFCGNFRERQFENARGFQFLFVGPPSVVPAARQDFFRKGMKCVEFFGGIVNKNCCSEGDNRAIVHGVIENGTRENKAVGEGDGDANGKAVRKIAQHTAGSGAVEVKRVADAGIHCRDDVGLRVRGKTDMTNEPFVENLVDGGAIVNGALRFAQDLRTLRRCKGIRHDGHRG